MKINPDLSILGQINIYLDELKSKEFNPVKIFIHTRDWNKLIKELEPLLNYSNEKREYPNCFMGIEIEDSPNMPENEIYFVI